MQRFFQCISLNLVCSLFLFKDESVNMETAWEIFRNFPEWDTLASPKAYFGFYNLYNVTAKLTTILKRICPMH